MGGRMVGQLRVMWTTTNKTLDSQHRTSDTDVTAGKDWLVAGVCNSTRTVKA